MSITSVSTWRRVNLVTLWALIAHVLTAKALALASTSTTHSNIGTPISNRVSDVAIVGCGVLGTSLCSQILSSPEFRSRSVTAITKTMTRHSEIRNQVVSTCANIEVNDRLRLKTMEEVLEDEAKFRDVVFCAPPSGFDDYPAAVEEALDRLWDKSESSGSGRGSFVFTSSGAVYSSADDALTVVDETSPTLDPSDPANARAARLRNSELRCLDKGGTVLRLAGLYDLGRGPHTFWLKRGEVQGGTNGVVNLLHYDDAARAVLQVLLLDPTASTPPRETPLFLVSDGHPMTRREICESARKARQLRDNPMPTFLGGGSENGDGDSAKTGKIYNGQWTNDVLGWKPVYAKSFDDFMESHRYT